MSRLINTFVFFGVFLPTLLGTVCSSQANACCPEDVSYTTEQEAEFLETEFFACVSLSMPMTIFQEMSPHLEKIGGAFVLRGFPNNSMQEFILKVAELKANGVHAPIVIDPDLFEECDIQEVPTFLLLQTLPMQNPEDMPSRSYQKIVGNVSIPYALGKMEEKQ